MVEGERPAARISATQLRTAALVILTSGGGAEPGQHLHLQRDLESGAGGQPEVVPGRYPLGGPLLESYLTTTGIAPQSAADVELDLSFSAFRVDEATFSLAVRFAGRVAVAHLVADD